MDCLSLHGVTVKFGGLTAANKVDLSVCANQIYSLIGPNGAGKTTVFNAITGVYPPSEGKVLFDGKEAKRSCSIRFLLLCTVIGVLSGLALLLLVNAEGIWYATISSKYTYRQPFDWAAAFEGFQSYLAATEKKFTLLPLILGMLLGVCGTLVMWSRSRVSPEVVSQAGIARTFQNIRLFKEMTVLENVLVGLSGKLNTRLWHAAFRLPKFFKEQRSAVAQGLAVLEFMGLKEFADWEAGNLCYGDQRRLEIARALVSSPKLLLLDEPAAGMNPSESVELMRIIRKIRDTGIAVLLIEHHMNLVMEVSDQITVLDYGNRIAQGTPLEIKSNPKVIEAYLGKESH